MLMQDRSVVITGSSRGIGAATARLMAAHGARVVVNHRDSADRAAAVVEEIRTAGGQAVALQADVTDPEQVARLFEKSRTHFGPLDALVNNAAITFPVRPWREFAWEDFERKLVSELKAAFFCSRAAVDQMEEKGGGAIVNVSSGLSRHPGYGFVAHSSAKAALDAFSRGLATELGPMGIRVNVVGPGLTETEATANQPPEMKEAIARQTPLQRIGLPDDVSGTILYLCSDLARFVSGAYVPVSGGMMMI
jgi:3-oxoacyl-[acyl-carrier protein] reductase